MEHILKFYGNHNLDFTVTAQDSLAYHITLELRRLEIPNFDDILLLSYDRIRAEDPQLLWRKQFEQTEWHPLAIPEIPGLEEKIRNVVLVGPMGLFLWFTPHHIEFTSAISERAAWYSPDNRKNVLTIRRYFYTIINRFGGDKAVYITEQQADNLYTMSTNAPGKAFTGLTTTLIKKYGAIKKSLFDYPPGKYPQYYIDTFSDLKIS